MDDRPLHNELIKQNIIFASGLTRSGKELLCSVVSGFDTMEKFHLDSNFENILELLHIKKIPMESAMYLLRANMNSVIHDYYLGRNVNFKPTDYTSIWNYNNPLIYIERLLAKDTDDVFDKMESESRKFILMLHDGLWHVKYVFKAFPLSKIIHIQRHPVDLAFSWLRKGYGGSIYSSRRNKIATYLFNGNIMPYYAFGWEEKYLSINECDRVINTISTLYKYHYDAYMNIEKYDKKRVLFVNHEELTTSPDSVIDSMKHFFKLDPSINMDEILKRERCPRALDISAREDKLKYLKNKSTSASYSILQSMVNGYETGNLKI